MKTLVRFVDQEAIVNDVRARHQLPRRGELMHRTLPREDLFDPPARNLVGVLNSEDAKAAKG